MFRFLVNTAKRRAFRKSGRQGKTSYMPCLEPLESRNLLSVQVAVAATVPWTDTGIAVEAGQQVTMTTDPTERVQFGFGGSTGIRTVNADGIGDEGVPPGVHGDQFGGPGAVLPNAIAISLIGKVGGTLAVGTGTPVPEGAAGKGAGFVGSSYSQVMTTGGELYLGFNDGVDYFFDNAGSFHVTIEVGKPDIVPAIDNSTLHKLIYRGQTLSVPLILNSQGGDAVGNVNIADYLSTDQATQISASDILLNTVTDQAVNIQAGQSFTLPPTVVTIPTDLLKGTYYLKAEIIPTTAPDSDLTDNIAVSAPLTACSNTNRMAGIRATFYEEAVTVAKEPHAIDGNTIAGFIKHNEAPNGPDLHVYIDNGNRAIGYGFDLTTNGKLHDAAQVRALIAQSGLKNFKGKPLTLEDLINGKGNIDQALADKLFDLALAEATDAARGAISNFDCLTYNQQKAILDLTYNVGEGGLRGFKRMIADIETGDFACAGFELFDSRRFNQLLGLSPLRTQMDFLLLVSGHEDEL